MDIKRSENPVMRRGCRAPVLRRIQGGASTDADMKTVMGWEREDYGRGFTDGEDAGRPPVVGLLLVNLFTFCCGVAFCAAVVFPVWAA